MTSLDIRVEFIDLTELTLVLALVPRKTSRVCRFDRVNLGMGHSAAKVEEVS